MTSASGGSPPTLPPLDDDVVVLEPFETAALLPAADGRGEDSDDATLEATATVCTEKKQEINNNKLYK